MKKLFLWMVGMMLLGFGLITSELLGNEEPQANDAIPVNDPGADFQRGVDNVRERGNQQGWDSFQRWGTLLFGEKTPDPLDPDATEQTQQINEGVEQRAQLASDFAQNASTVVSAAAPAPNEAANAAQLVIGEAVNQATQQPQQPPPQPAQPGLWQRFVNWVKSWFN